MNVMETTALGRRFGWTWALRNCSLAINPNTVLKAYRELEHRGIAAGRPGQGTFVEVTPAVVPLAELTGLRKSLLTWVGTADAAGLDADGMAALFTAALRDFHERRAATGAPRGEPETINRDRRETA